jgi:hypothetical protein
MSAETFLFDNSSCFFPTAFPSQIPLEKPKDYIPFTVQHFGWKCEITCISAMAIVKCEMMYFLYICLVVLC